MIWRHLVNFEYDFKYEENRMKNKQDSYSFTTKIKIEKERYFLPARLNRREEYSEKNLTSEEFQIDPINIDIRPKKK